MCCSKHNLKTELETFINHLTHITVYNVCETECRTPVFGSKTYMSTESHVKYILLHIFTQFLCNEIEKPLVTYMSCNNVLNYTIINPKHQTLHKSHINKYSPTSEE